MLCTLLLLAQEPSRKPTLTGNIERMPAFESKTLGNRRDILIYLPPGYGNDTKRRYPVAYFHDGQNVFDGATSFIPNQEWRADETAQAMIEAGLIEPIIMIAIPNMGAERSNEYLPTRFKMRDTEIGGKADDYGKFLADELKPEIDRKFRTQASRSALIGASLGGIVSLHLGLTRPNTFGMLGVMSPSVWVDDRIMLKKISALPNRPNLKVWVDMGGSEGPNALDDARKLRDALAAKGWSQGRDLLYFEEHNAEHNEAAWARRLPLVLRFFFGKAK